MRTLQQDQFPIDRSIFAEALTCIPEHWSRMRLRARMIKTVSGEISIGIDIDGMDQEGLAIVSDHLQHEVRQLFLLYESYGANLQGISYEYKQAHDSRWSFSGNYEYMEE